MGLTLTKEVLPPRQAPSAPRDAVEAAEIAAEAAEDAAAAADRARVTMVRYIWASLFVLGLSHMILKLLETGLL